MGAKLEAAIEKSPERYGMPVAVAILHEAVERLEPVGILDTSGGYENWSQEIMGLVNGDVVPIDRVRELRMGPEYLKANAVEGDALICAIKMALSAWWVACTNSFSTILENRDIDHDDIDPLLQKAVALMSTADHPLAEDFTVEWDDSVIPAVHQEQQKGQLGYLIKTAIRPTDVGGSA